MSFAFKLGQHLVKAALDPAAPVKPKLPQLPTSMPPKPAAMPGRPQLPTTMPPAAGGSPRPMDVIRGIRDGRAPTAAPRAPRPAPAPAPAPAAAPVPPAAPGRLAPRKPLTPKSQLKYGPGPQYDFHPYLGGKLPTSVPSDPSIVEFTDGQQQGNPNAEPGPSNGAMGLLGAGLSAFGGLPGVGVGQLWNAGFEGLDLATNGGRWSKSQNTFNKETTPTLNKGLARGVASYAGASGNAIANPIRSIQNLGTGAYDIGKARGMAPRQEKSIANIGSGATSGLAAAAGGLDDSGLWNRGNDGKMYPNAQYMQGGVDKATWGRLRSGMPHLPSDPSTYNPNQFIAKQ